MTQDQVKELFEYRDGELYRLISVSRVKVGDKTGTLDSKGYKVTKINNQIYKNHRIIFLMFHGYLPKFIDHIDGNPSNNRIENLREATRSENAYNRKTLAINKFGVKNVYWGKLGKNWRVMVQVKGIRKYFGAYKDLELAELIATMAREKYHGEFACH